MAHGGELVQKPVANSHSGAKRRQGCDHFLPRPSPADALRRQRPAGFICSTVVECVGTTCISAILAKFRAELLQFEPADEPHGDHTKCRLSVWGLLRTCIYNKLSGEVQKGARELRAPVLHDTVLCAAP